MHKDTLEVIQKCRASQINAPVQRSPRHDLIPNTSAWPFHKWAIDIVGPFPPDQGNVKFLVVAIDYFTKWVEVKPLSIITGNKVLTFVWEDIVCRFGIPHEIVSDNGKQFADNLFKSWCAGLQIKQTFTSVEHPQANGQVEVTNRDIVSGIKARLDGCQNGWAEELPNVLWAHRTSPKESTGETPYSLVYGSEAVIPAEISVPTPRVAQFNADVNIANQRGNLDKIEERRGYAALREAENKRRIAQYYNRMVHPLTFIVGDYVWRKNEASHAESTGKLGPNWEGPYRIATCHGNGAYSLITVNGSPLPRTWHATNLKRCYV